MDSAAEPQKARRFIYFAAEAALLQRSGVSMAPPLAVKITWIMDVIVAMFLERGGAGGAIVVSNFFSLSKIESQGRPT